MDVNVILSERIGMNEIRAILHQVKNDDRLKQDLYDLTIHNEGMAGYQAAWVLTHFTVRENQWLLLKQEELIDTLLLCQHAGKKRLILTILYKLPFELLRVDLLDFCLGHMVSGHELPGVKSLCMKIAYELCRTVPELMQELKSLLDIMEEEQTPALITTKKSIFNAIKKGKSLQKLTIPH
ncbi:MAG: hypothetical protein PHG27_01655 [Massilibacteroides sp.]|nr:hypothetical protein [Massilibacteroides sp.]MDD3061665.1 hypothetical protein [Massilibacteroides sp.]MDD4114292.1 hypothetical protein [Massilibacteroides sp.]MDD4659951.1 hypothetical protein [Massilibacteroides sp.]